MTTVQVEKHSRPRPGPQNSRVALLVDELDRGIRDHLGIEAASAADIASRLGVPAATVRRRLRRLVASGIVDRQGKTRRRGVSEFLYAMRFDRGLLRYGELGDISERQHEEAASGLLRQMFRETIEAVEAGSFSALDGFRLSRFPVPLDQIGWDEARVLHESVAYAIIDAGDRAAARLEDCDERAVVAHAYVLFAEAPEPWPIPFPEAAASLQPARGRSRHNRIRALANPLRVKLLDALSLHPASAGELAERIKAPNEAVRYELRRMREEGAIRVHSRRKRRGTEELVYLGDGQVPTLRPEEGLDDSESAVEGYCRDVAIELFRGTVAALRSGSFASEDHALVRVVRQVDAQAFKE